MCLANSMGLPCSSHAPARFLTDASGAYPSRFLSGTHKNYSLVDCPIYSVVKNRGARNIAGRVPASTGFGLTKSQPKVRSQATGLGSQPQVALLDLSANADRRPVSSGGADRDRTGDLLVANQALSQLSYSPNRSSRSVSSGGPG